MPRGVYEVSCCEHCDQLRVTLKARMSAAMAQEHMQMRRMLLKDDYENEIRRAKKIVEMGLVQKYAYDRAGSVKDQLSGNFRRLHDIKIAQGHLADDIDGEESANSDLKQKHSARSADLSNLYERVRGIWGISQDTLDKLSKEERELQIVWEETLKLLATPVESEET